MTTTSAFRPLRYCLVHLDLESNMQSLTPDMSSLDNFFRRTWAGLKLLALMMLVGYGCAVLIGLISFYDYMLM